MTRRPKIGLDFDNTIILYDDVFVSTGIGMGLLPDGFRGNKLDVRSRVRALDRGETKWCALQAAVYGPGVAEARIAPGTLDFLARCREAGTRVCIVSHKTQTAAADPTGVNLRDAAWNWIARHGLTDVNRGGIDTADVFFETTREEKIARIARLGCSHFVDDLEEVFLEPAFPPHVTRHLLLHGAGDLPSGPFLAHRTWSDVAKAVLADADRSAVRQ